MVHLIAKPSFRRVFFRRDLTISMLLLALAVAPAATAQGPAIEPAEAPAPSSGKGPELRSAAASVDLGRLGAVGLADVDASVNPADQLSIRLFDGRQIDVTVDRVEFPAPSTLTWTAGVHGDPQGRVILAITGPRVDGFIHLSDASYEIRSEPGATRLVELDASELIPHSCLPPTWSPQGGGGEGGGPAPGSSDDGSVVDVMVVYSPQAADDEAALRNRIALGIAVGNDILQNSQIDTRFRLVFSGLGDIDESDPDYTNTPFLMLLRLTDPDDGYYDQIPVRRDQVAADVAVVLVEDLQIGVTGQAAGVMEGLDPSFESDAYAVIRNLQVGTFALAHEIGHLMGSHHHLDSLTSPPPAGAFPFSYAFLESEDRFATVMASGGIPYGTPRALIFSSPGLTVDGRPAGSAVENNVASLNGARQVVANFRQSGTADCDLPPGHPDYCLECGPCSSGLGDCDEEDPGQCQAGLVCTSNVGPDYGFGERVDVCLPPVTTCQLPLGHPDYCLDANCGPCGAGEGDCDEEDPTQCLPGLVCSTNVGPDYGFGPNIDVCEAPALPKTLLLNAVDDAFVAAESPDTNFGLRTELRVRYAGGDGQGYGRFSFVRFQVPPIPGAVLSAKLRLWVQDVPIPEVGFYEVAMDPWSETAITWNNWGHPSQASFLGAVQNAGPWTWVEFDVTSSIEQSGGSVTFGLAAGGTADFGQQDFSSRQTASGPRLVIVHE